MSATTNYTACEAYGHDWQGVSADGSWWAVCRRVHCWSRVLLVDNSASPTMTGSVSLRLVGACEYEGCDKEALTIMPYCPEHALEVIEAQSQREQVDRDNAGGSAEPTY